MPAAANRSTLVAPRARGPRARGGCAICQLPLDLVQRLNAIIWDGTQSRVDAYRASGQRFLAQEGHEFAVRAITTHANHTEKAWRVASQDKPAVGKEQPVFPTDFTSVAERATILGLKAMEDLEGQVKAGLVEPRELVAISRMGLIAATERQKADDRSKRPMVTVQALFGIVSGHVDTPVGEVKNVTPLPELRVEVEAEREALRLHAGYTDTMLNDEGEIDELASVL